MSRKNVLRSYSMATDLPAADFDTKSNPTEVSFLDNGGITVEWTGTPVGLISVFVSNDDANPKQGKPVVNWVELDFGSPVVVDATNSNLLINMNQLPFAWLAIGYDHTSGTGTLSAQLTAKMV